MSDTARTKAYEVPDAGPGNIDIIMQSVHVRTYSYSIVHALVQGLSFESWMLGQTTCIACVLALPHELRSMSTGRKQRPKIDRQSPG